ncbi:hypothetical protein F9B85_04055 [Heliorestis acidaminivorans]|uniref:Uncharacterized protein n=1 Tax=Heliorestis acidaminivorans TaxID=553427 RepID=A0A6I0EW14_9FIRM|nr:hypothetical protein [Heliorestis acidaminivorans]KAB2953799.1 hypothetical protein F9B85_04055 [Heliorestis acidaminivorans]
MGKKGTILTSLFLTGTLLLSPSAWAMNTVTVTEMVEVKRVGEETFDAEAIYVEAFEEPFDGE